MKDYFKRLLGDQFCLWVSAFSLTFLLLGCILLFLSFQKLPPQIPLFFSRPWGEEQLAPKLQILLLPGIAALIFLVNFSLALKAATGRLLLSRLLLATGAILIFALILALIQIVDLIS